MSAIAKILLGMIGLAAVGGGYVEFVRDQADACISPQSVLRERACDKAVQQAGQPSKIAALIHGARVRVKTIYAATSLGDALKAVELDPSNLDHQILLVRTLEAQRKLDEAAGPLFNVLAARPDDREALYAANSMCRGYGGAVNIDNRLRGCTAVIDFQLRPATFWSAHTLTNALRDRMRLRFASNDLAGAEADAGLLLHEKASDREALVVQGQVLLERGDRDRAMTAFETAVRQKSDMDENDRKAIAAAQAAMASALTPVTIRTGVVSQRRARQAVAPLKITASPSASVLIKAFELGGQTAELVAFIRAGETLETKMPVGVFEIKVASGDTWYGLKRMFGPATRFSKLASTFDFSTTSTGYSGNRIELVTQAAGNLAQQSIDPSNF